MIRHANIEDAEAIAKLHVQSWQETYQDMVYPHILAEHNLEKRLQLWPQVLKLDNHIVLLSEQAGQLQGFIDVSLNEEKGVAKIMALYVLKSAQKQGIGRQLFERAMADVHPLQYPQVMLDVYDKNPACQFYEYLGAACIASEDASQEGDQLKVSYYLWERDAFSDLPVLLGE